MSESVVCRVSTTVADWFGIPCKESPKPGAQGSVATGASQDAVPAPALSAKDTVTTEPTPQRQLAYLESRCRPGALGCSY